VTTVSGGALEVLGAEATVPPATDRLATGKFGVEGLGANTVALAATPPRPVAVDKAAPDGLPPPVLGEPQALLAAIARDISERSKRIMRTTLQGNLSESTADYVSQKARESLRIFPADKL
jgi:hypothetical protein